MAKAGNSLANGAGGRRILDRQNLYPSGAAVTLRTSAMVVIRAIGPIDVATVILLALKRPDVLKMVGALERRLSQKALVVAV
jgi:hypothetical protein